MKFDIRIVSFLVSVSAVCSQTIRGATTMERTLGSVCINNTPFVGLDGGCNVDFPLCARSDGHKPAADVAGDYCGKCHNVWNTDKVVDWGCTESEPACDAALGLIGMQCMPAKIDPQPACKNSGAFGAKDQGCTDETPICYNADMQKEVGSYAPGNACARCLNSFVNLFHQYGISNYGCPRDQPRCIMTDGNNPTLNTVGSRCCPVGGCPISCPCNIPDTFFDFAVNHSPVGAFACYEDERGVIIGENESSEWFGAGEAMPGFWACSSGGAAFGCHELGGITPEEGCACLALIRAECFPPFVDETIQYNTI